LVNVAQSRGKFKKGGVADIENAARLVIEDWNSGRMNHFVPPPGFDPTVLLNYKSEMEADVDHYDDTLTRGGMITEMEIERGEDNKMEMDN